MGLASLEKLRAACAEARIDVPPLLAALYEGAGELADALRWIALAPKVLRVGALDLPPARRAWLRDRFVGFAALDAQRVLGLWRPPGAPRGRAVVAVVAPQGPRFFSVGANAIAPALRSRIAAYAEPSDDADEDDVAELGDAIAELEAWLAARATPDDEVPPGEKDLLALRQVNPRVNNEGEASQAIKAALRHGDLARARDLATLLRTSVASDEEGGRVSIMLFHEGQVAEAEGDLDEAVRLFRACRDLDEEIRPEGDVALPEVHRSLAIVLGKAGLCDEALAANVRAGTLYQARRDPLAVETFSHAAALALQAGDHPRADDLASKAIRASSGVRGVAALDLLYAHVIRAQALIARRRFKDALLDLTDASRIAVDDSPDGRRARAECWLHLGATSVVFGANHQAAACYATTLALTDAAGIAAAAREGLAAISERLDSPLDGFRVVYVDREAQRAHVMHATKGFYVARDPGDVTVGERVDVDVTGDGPLVSITRPAPP